LIYLGAPLRRVLFRPWFALMGRIGTTGLADVFLAPLPMTLDSTEKIYKASFRAQRSGELFLYVNDALVPLPWINDVFYRNNKGTATVLITRRN
jgi:hypothetical protein